MKFPAGEGRGVILGRDPLEGMGGLWGETFLAISSLEDTRSGCRIGGWEGPGGVCIGDGREG